MWPWNFHEWHVFHVVHVLHYFHVHGCSWPLTWGTVCHSFCCSYLGCSTFFLPLHHQQSLCGPRNMNGKSWSCGLGRGVTATFMAFATKTVDPGSFRFLVCDWFTACLWLTHVVDQAEEWMWQRMHIMRRMRLHEAHGTCMCYMWQTVSVHIQASCENTVGGCVECIIVTCLSNFERKSLNMRSNSEDCFPEFLMSCWWSFDAVLKLHQNDAVLMQFHMKSDAVLMQFQNCIRIASCFLLNFHIFSSQKMKIWRPNDWLDMNIIVTSKLISCHHFSQVSSAQASCNATSKSSSALNSKQVTSKSKKCLPVK